MPKKLCPIWVGYLMASPVRRLFEDPYRLIRPHVQPGGTVLDIGCAMGYLSLPAARLVGSHGRVVCVDLQPRMIEVLRRRASRSRLLGRMELQVCQESDLGVGDLDSCVDLALAIHVVHEVPQVPRFFDQVVRTLRRSGRLLMVEPKGHVRSEEFAETRDLAVSARLTIIDHPPVRRGYGVVLVKP